MSRQREGRVPELDGLRVLMIFIVSWYHIWQQSWLTPVIHVPAAGLWYSLDYLVRSGYVWVDGTVLLSAFLLYLPLCRSGQKELPDVRDFYFRKARRILPGYVFIILLFFFGMCLPWDLYRGNGPYMVKDLFAHLTLIFPYFRDTYVYSPMGAAPWTLSLVAQAYLLFPLIARGLGRKPYMTLGILAGISLAFRAWCVWGLTDFTMVVNTLANFLDVYAVGFGAAMIFARLEKAAKAAGAAGAPAGAAAGQGAAAAPGKSRKIFWQILATVAFIGCLAGLLAMLKLQASHGNHDELQKYQMLYRPVFALCFAGLVLSAPFSVKPLRFLLGNRVTAFLSAVSMNYYLTHQTIAVHLKRIGFPPSVSDTPNTAGEQPWQTQYTLAAFGISLAAAVLITYLVEKPVGKWLGRIRERRAGSGDPV